METGEKVLQTGRCMRCRDTRTMVPHQDKTDLHVDIHKRQSGREVNILKGQCKDCGSKMSRFVGRPKS